MAQLLSWWSWLAPFKRLPLIDRYHVSVVTNPTELEYSELLPLEIRYVLAVRPSRHQAFHGLLSHRFGVGVRTVDKTPERVLQAVDRISHECQHNTIVPWLEKLLRHEELPIFSEEELRLAEAKGINLYKEIQIILSQRFEFKKIVLVPLDNQVVTQDQQNLLKEINQDLYPYAIDVIINRVTFDAAHTRTEVAQSILKALLVIGPIAHLLESALSGIGKIFAAVSDDLLSETAELFALRGSGFTWRQLLGRSYLLIPVFLIATIGAFQVEPLIDQGRNVTAGIVFGLSAVALSLTTAIASVGLYYAAYARLVEEGKLRLEGGRGLLWHALHQDFTNPARLGLFVGAVASPVVAACVFSLVPIWTHNGWVLALLGSVESVVAGLTVIGSAHLNTWRFRLRMRRALRSVIVRP